MKTEKIQKVLANLGIASRRQIEKWIVAGRIQVNGRPAALGQRIHNKVTVSLDGKKIEFDRTTGAQNIRVLMYHKQEGEVCSRNDPEKRPIVFGGLPKLHQARWVMVGRLDIATTGLLLFTNNGELANRLMHPSYEIIREYTVRVFGRVSDDMIMNLRRGVKIDDQVMKFDDLEFIGGDRANQWYKVTLREGRNREVRKLWESQGLQVSRLKRVRYATLILPRNLRAGKYLELNQQQTNELLELVKLA